jgi:hypothetical protein
LIKRFSGKRYLVMIKVDSFEDLDHFRIDRARYSNMDDWLPVENIEMVKISTIA